MNTTFTHWFTLICAAGGLACVAALVLYSARHLLRELLDQLYAASRLTKLVILLAVAGATFYAGAKHGSPTNEPPADISGDSSPTNDPPVGGDVLGAPQSLNNAISLCGDCGVPGGHALPSTLMLPPPSTSTFNLNLVTNWHARGAWMDWKRIDFPDTFAFPSGTNLLTGVTLMSYGELRESLRGPVVANVFATSNQLPTTSYQLPTLSLEPDASSVSYGLTPSNSFVFVWENACVNRETTNRVNAAIEFFESGAIAITTQFGDQPPTTNYQLPTNPPDFIGEGQDNNWATNAFPFAAEAITNTGYTAWLEDYIGVNEANGRYMLKVTIASLPTGPCYLSCGPYRMVVKEPGTYAFPLTDLETYTVRTYPEAIPLTFEYEDGFHPYSDDETPLMMSAPRPRRTAASGNPDNVYTIQRFPEVFVRPNYLTLDQARQATIHVTCNAAGIAARDYTTLFGSISLWFTNPSDEVLIEAQTQAEVQFIFSVGGNVCSGTLTIGPNRPYDPNENPESTNEWNHAGSTNDTSNASQP